MKRHILLLLLLVLVSYGIYANAFRNGFVWDDEVFITNNQKIRSMDLPRFFKTGDEDLYRPLRTTLYSVTWHFAADNEVAYHLVGKTMNVMVVLILYAMLFLLFNDPWGAFWGALLFAVHPVHTEKVTFITSTYDIPADVCWLGAFVLFLLYRRGYTLFTLSGSLALFTASLFFAENAAVLPLVVVLYDLTIGREGRRPLLWVPYFAVLVLFIVLRTYVLGSIARGGGPAITPDLIGNLFTMSGSTLLYFKLLIWPWPLSPTQHGVVFASAPYPPQLWGVLAALAAVAVAVWRLRGAYAWAAFGFFWFFVVLSPNMNFIPTRNLFAERYLYMPSAALSLFIAALYVHLEADARRRKLFIAAVLVICVLFSTLTVIRNRDWRDEGVLWKEAMKADPDSAMPVHNFGMWALEHGNPDAAGNFFAAAAEMDRGDPRNLASLAAHHMAHQRYAEALKVYSELYALHPYPSYLVDLYVARINLGKLDNAEEFFQAMLQRFPDSASTHCILGGVQYLKRKPEWWGPMVRSWALGGGARPLEDMAQAWLAEKNYDGAAHIARFGLTNNTESPKLRAMLKGIEEMPRSPEKRR